MRLVAVLATLFVSAPSYAITLGQSATFENGHDGWTGSPLFSLIGDGGPNGAGDAYLQAVTGIEPTSLRVYGRTWGGDYVAAGVKAIEADFLNLGNSDLSIRIFFSSPSQPETFVSISPFLLTTDELWHRMRFELSPSDITPDPALALHDVGPIGFTHLVEGTDIDGSPVVGSFGIDNIRTVPEPVSLALFLSAAVASVSRKLFRR